MDQVRTGYYLILLINPFFKRYSFELDEKENNMITPYFPASYRYPIIKYLSWQVKILKKVPLVGIKSSDIIFFMQLSRPPISDACASL